MDFIAEQIEQEERLDAQSEAKALAEFKEHLASGNVDKLPKAKVLLGNAFPWVLASIQAEQAKTIRGVGAKVRGWLREVPADVASVLAIRATLRTVLKAAGAKTDFGATMQRISMAIGREWIQEALIRQAEKINPAYYDAAMKGLDRANVSSQKHISMTVSRVIRNTLNGLYDNPLADAELLQLGKFGLQACLDAGLVEMVRDVGSQGHIVTYQLTEQVKGFLGDEMTAMRLAPSIMMPMLAPPLPWTNIVGGGYYTEKRQARNPLISYFRHVRRSQLGRYRASLGHDQMPAVYQYVNYVQSIPYRLNSEVFAHVERIWRNGGGAMGVPVAAPPIKPEFPFSEEWSKASASEAELIIFQRWKRRVTMWHEERKKHASTLWEIVHFTKNGRRYAERDMYFPVFLDSRGRLYYRGALNPQGGDASKAVLHFAEKRKLGERGVYWLKVHIANCFGVDQPKFDVRAAWTDEHWERLRGALERPEESGVFDEADSPMMALAACMELEKAYQSGDPYSFESGLPIHMDATCSGLQHFSAMLRDPVGGQYVNLIPGGDRKADIYRRVAELAMLQVERDAAGQNPLALEWQRLGVSRSLAKGPVMTYVYGATLRSVVEGIECWLVDEGWKSDTISYRKMGNYMGQLLFKAIEDTVPAAAAAMRWLRACVLKAERDTGMRWTTLLGLPVNHDYRDSEKTRVRVRSCGMEYVVMYNMLDTTQTRSMQNAIAPNFVHSLDGTHLGLTALRMQARGMQMVCIHDSFGTHPCDVDVMHECIRDAFVHLYSRDTLADFANQLNVEMEPPQVGTLNLEDVRRSEFVFC